MFYYKGPEGWSKEFPTCGKNRQSPIDIRLSSQKLEVRDKILYHNYFRYPGPNWDNPYAKYSLVNTGHSLQIKLPVDNPYRLSYKGWWGHKTWIPMHINLHYSTTNEMGSEHKVNGWKKSGEVRVL